MMEAKIKTRQRRREKVAIFLLGLVCLSLAWLEIRLFAMSESLPFQHSLFFFGLVNFNIILFLFLLFLIFRNIVKNFAEREGGPIGSSLKSKLIAAFVGFSFVPTALMFTISVFYINNSFDRWFNEKTSSVLKSSLEVTNTYYSTAKKRNYHFADLVAKDLDVLGSEKRIRGQLESLRKKYSIDSIEYYPDLLSEPFQSLDESVGVENLPPVSLEFLKKGIQAKNESSTIHHFSGGDIIRVVVPVPGSFEAGAIVVSSFVPISLISRMDIIAEAYESFRDMDPLAYPVKSIYLIILVLMSLVIILAATWFGFYLAKQLSIPLEKLVLGTQRVVKGDYRDVEAVSGSPEINRLISNFNQMAQFLGESKRELMEANQSLRKTLAQLDEHSQYMDLVLARVNTGVISVDKDGRLAMVNRHAEKLLGVEAKALVGHELKDVMPVEFASRCDELVKKMQVYCSETVEQEVTVSLGGKTLLLEIVVTMLRDEKGQEFGKVVVFDDLSLIVNAQRAAAWTEVARRIAHEIKNPLTPISLAAQRLQRKFGGEISDPAFKDCTEMIVSQVDGLKNLVNEFSQFARMPKINPILGDLNACVQESLKIYAQGERHFKIQFTKAEDLPMFKFDSQLIDRAVMNLVENAGESLQGLDNALVKVAVEYNRGMRMARIVVEDNGPGIPSHLADRIFEPYMTTKKHGTGLGLPIVKRTVEDHNGYIRVSAVVPHGCRFVIELPLGEVKASEVDVNKGQEMERA